MSWIMPTPTLDEDDRFYAVIDFEADPPMGGILGPSGLGCYLCGGPPAGAVRAELSRTVDSLVCAEHRAFALAQISILLAEKLGAW